MITNLAILMSNTRTWESRTISRHAVSNRPPIPTIEELDDIFIGDSYRIVTIDNLPQNFVLHKKTILNEDNVRVGFMILGTNIFLCKLLSSIYVSGDGTIRTKKEVLQGEWGTDRSAYVRQSDR